jgi:hypothetical protein
MATMNGKIKTIETGKNTFRSGRIRTEASIASSSSKTRVSPCMK